MSFRKPEWLDTAVGIAGLGLGVFALLLGSKVSTRSSIYGAIGFSLFVILASVIFRPRYSFKSIPTKEWETFLERSAKMAREVVLINPSGRHIQLNRYVSQTLAQRANVSIIGCAPHLQDLMNLLEAELHIHFLGKVFLSESISDEPMICIVSRDMGSLTLMVPAERETMVYRLWDQKIVRKVFSIIKREGDPSRHFARLDHASDGLTFLNAFVVEQRKYADNFDSLRLGSISYEGSAVQQLQSSLVESGRCRRLDTLDLTTSPETLLMRRRYFDANRGFIESGGVVRRVYMIEQRKESDASFMNDLGELVRQQRAIKVNLGLVIIDDLDPSLRKDFILFDDSLVLVEERQANLDYTLGRSTAYFTKAQVLRYREHFNRVWYQPIRGCTPAQRIHQIFPPA